MSTNQAPYTPYIETFAAIVVAGAWVLLLDDQFPANNRVGTCWFYNPALEELSPSEILSVVFWCVAAVLMVWREKIISVRGALAVAFVICALEEANYGVPYVSALLGEYRTGTSVHNGIEALNQRGFWLFESVLKLVLCLTIYPTIAVLGFRRAPRSRAFLYALPAFLFAITTFRTLSWNLAQGGAVLSEVLIQEINNHPCLWVEEELQEFLLSASCVLWTALGWPGRR
ncbi:MAG: hypothetical protein AAFY60_08185 [Myxococcota bacterium]